VTAPTLMATFNSTVQSDLFAGHQLHSQNSLPLAHPASAQ
jgi:hypothetical protein